MWVLAGCLARLDSVLTQCSRVKSRASADTALPCQHPLPTQAGGGNIPGRTTVRGIWWLSDASGSASRVSATRQLGNSAICDMQHNTCCLRGQEAVGYMGPCTWPGCCAFTRCPALCANIGDGGRTRGGGLRAQFRKEQRAQPRQPRRSRGYQTASMTGAVYSVRVLSR